jgi:hypothetical protein
MRPFVQTVISNLKSPDPEGGEWTVNLGQRTLIVGPNTSHKSAILQAIELAMSGAADDIVGRNNVRDGSLLLTASPTSVLSCRATLSNGEHSSFFVEEGKRPVHQGDPTTMPLRAVRAALASSPDSAKKAFLQWVIGPNITVEEFIPADLRGRFNDLAAGDTPVETLLNVLEYAGKKQRAAASEAKGAQAVAEEMRNTMVEPPDEDEIKRLQAQIAGCSGTTNHRQLQDAQASLSQWTEQATQLKLSLEEHSVDLMSNLLSVLNVSVFDEHDSCPACSSQVGREHLIACRDHYAEVLEPHSSDLASLAFAEDEMTRWHWQTFHLKQSSASSSEPVNLAALQQRLEDLQRAHVQWESLKRSNDVVQDLQTSVDEYKRLKAACQKAIDKLLNENIEGFCQEVSGYLPTDWTFGVQLKDGKKNVFRCGLLHEGTVRCALSGAEWAAVTTAIAMAVTNRSLSPSSPSVLIPEDRAWDQRTLASVMREYGKFEGQVVIASTVRPRGRPSKAWTIIDLERDPLFVSDIEVLPVEEAEETRIDSEEGPVVVRRSSAMRLLRNLGYNDEVIERMSTETSLEITTSGFLAEHTTVHEDGTFSVSRSDDLQNHLPRLQ